MSGIEKEAQIDEKRELSDDLFPDFRMALSLDQSKKEALLIEKLQLIDRYITLTESINKKFKDGFIELSRANYAKAGTMNVKYGKDYWDDNVKATSKLEIKGDNMVLINQEIEVVQDLKDSIKSLRRRKNQDLVKEGEEVKESKKKLYDPINMFGVLVPYQLKASQSSFKGSLNDIVELVNLKNKMEKLNIDLIKELKDTNKSKITSISGTVEEGK